MPERSLIRYNFVYFFAKFRNGGKNNKKKWKFKLISWCPRSQRECRSKRDARTETNDDESINDKGQNQKSQFDHLPFAAILS